MKKIDKRKIYHWICFDRIKMYLFKGKDKDLPRFNKLSICSVINEKVYKKFSKEINGK